MSENNKDLMDDLLMSVDDATVHYPDYNSTSDDNTSKDDTLSSEEIEYFNSIVNSDENNNDVLPDVMSTSDSNGYEDNEDVDNGISFLRRISEKTEEDADDDLEQVVAEQYHNTRHNRIYSPPSDTILIEQVPPDPTPYIPTYDNKNMKKLALLVSLMIILILLIVMIGLSWMLSQKKANDPDPGTIGSMTNSAALGNIIMNSQGDVSSSVSSSNESSSSVSSATNSNTVSGQETFDASSVSKIQYKVTASDGIHNAAAAFIKGEGDQVTENFMTFPWEKEEQLKSNIVPQIGVSTIGEGDLTCTVMKDGKEVSTKTSTGKDPSVIC